MQGVEKRGRRAVRLESGNTELPLLEELLRRVFRAVVSWTLTIRGVKQLMAA